MLKYLARHGFSAGARTGLLLLGLGLLISFGLYLQLFMKTRAVPVPPGTAQKHAGERGVDFSREAARISKADLAAQLAQLTAATRKLEMDGADHGPLGVRIYAPETSARLFQLYQGMQQRLEYLNNGRGAFSGADSAWQDYRFLKEPNRPIQIREIEDGLHFIQQYAWAGNLLNGFRIFLLPYTIPEVSGLGGAGYIMLSALGNPNEPANVTAEEIRVTLYHEIGHHLHLSRMPEESAAGQALWRKYLTIRGAVWHGPGKVKTQDWNNSSEETFAEDFRMLFGKDQPFYKDIALGDPRANPDRAALLRHFMQQLAVRPAGTAYQSPWEPDAAAILFWQVQPLLIAALWLVLGGSLWLMKSLSTKTGSSEKGYPKESYRMSATRMSVTRP